MAISAGVALLSSSVAAATGTLVTYAVIGGSFLANFAVSFVLGAAMNALTPKPSSGGSANRGYQVNSKGAALDHQIIYGKVRVGGAIVYDESTGTDNKFLHRIIAVAGHEVQSFDRIYIDDSYIDFGNIAGDGNIPSVIDPDGSTSTRYNNKIRIQFGYGTPTQPANAALVSESASWTSQHTLSGIAYMYVRLEFDADVFPNGIPTITAEVKGKKVYDPRTTTTVWSDNPALCLRDYLTSKYGVNEDTSNVDDTLVTAAANVCDETISGLARYTCNGSFTTGATPYDLLQSILTSMGGTMWYAQGKWRMKPAYWTTPVMDLNEDDFRSSVSLSTRHSRRDNFNVVKGTFRGEETNWQVTDYPQVTNADFVSADGGQESVVDINLAFTDNSIEARRLARVALEANRQQLTISASFGLRTLALQVGDNVRITNTRFGWINKEFIVLSWSFGLVDEYDLQVNMVLQETASSVFDEVDDGIIYERDNTNLPSPFFVPAVGVNVTATAQVSNQKITNIAEIVVTSSSPQFIDRVEVEFKPSGSSSWKSVGNGFLGVFEVIDLEVGNYDFRARAVSVLGIRGELTTLTDIEINPFTGPPSDVTGFFAEVSGNSLFLKWGAIPDPDLSHYIIKHSPAYSGAIWSTSSTIVEKVARPSTSVAVPARAGTYLIKAFDKEGFLSEIESTFVVLAESIPPLGAIETVTEDPTFTGTKSNVLLTSGTIEIDNTSAATPEGTYTFTGTVDLLSVRNARVTGYVTFTRKYDDGTLLWDAIPQSFDTWPSVFDNWTDQTIGFADIDAKVYVSSTNDDPASGSAVWSAYELASGGFFLGRGFRFKTILTSNSSYYTPNISALSVTVEY